MSDDPRLDAIRARLRSGDPAAIADLYDRSATGLHRVLRALLGTAAAADEALQDVFVAVARRAQAVADADDLDAYVARMARNRALDLLRRQRRQPRIEPGEPAWEPAPDDREVGPAVAAAVAALPLEQREVVVLKLWHGLTFAQIAVATGVPADTAASRYRYALAKLRVRLGDHQHADR